MYVSTDVYIKRINHTLEKVVAPEVESDHARGQVFAVINLLEQLASMIEYKRELFAQELMMGKQALDEIAGALSGAGVELPEDIQSFIAEFDSKADADLAACGRMDKMISAGIELLRERKDKMDGENADRVDKKVRGYITKLATRDLGLLKPPAIDKISRPEKYKKPKA
jgi:hypothetical protein